MAAIPYIMPKRYDAWNTITENIDEEVIKAYIREKRRGGVRINHMAVIIAAYYKAYQTNPKLNWFVVNSHLYERNHFCVSFVILKKAGGRHAGRDDAEDLSGAAGQYLHHQPKDRGHHRQKLRRVPQQQHRQIRQDDVLHPRPAQVCDLAGLSSDKHGLLPRKIVDLSPFHTSMFITNLASIKTSYIHHHCYEFGTTSVFVCMGKPVPNYMSGDLTKKMMPLGIVMDERICTGYEYAAFCNDSHIHGGPPNPRGGAGGASKPKNNPPRGRGGFFFLPR